MDCPTPFKVYYESPARARKAARRIANGSKRRKYDRFAPSHAYQCMCGGYHLTTQRVQSRASVAARRQYESSWEEEWTA